MSLKESVISSAKIADKAVNLIVREAEKAEIAVDQEAMFRQIFEALMFDVNSSSLKAEILSEQE